MSEVAYNRVTTLAVVASVTSVLLYDRFASLRWIAIALGGVAVALAAYCYVTQRFLASRDEVDIKAQELSVAVVKPGYLLEAIPDEKSTQTFVNLAWDPGVFEAEFTEYALHTWKHRIDEHLALLCERDALVVGKAPDPHVMAEAAVRIANQLSSDKLEVVLTPTGQVIVRPCMVSVQNARQNQMELRDLLGEASTRPN